MASLQEVASPGFPALLLVAGGRMECAPTKGVCSVLPAGRVACGLGEFGSASQPCSTCLQLQLHGTIGQLLRWQ